MIKDATHCGKNIQALQCNALIKCPYLLVLAIQAPLVAVFCTTLHTTTKVNLVPYSSLADGLRLSTSTHQLCSLHFAFKNESFLQDEAKIHLPMHNMASDIDWGVKLDQMGICGLEYLKREGCRWLNDKVSRYFFPGFHRLCICFGETTLATLNCQLVAQLATLATLATGQAC